jgi:hypothetical protein
VKGLRRAVHHWGIDLQQEDERLSAARTAGACIAAEVRGKIRWIQPCRSAANLQQSSFEAFALVVMGRGGALLSTALRNLAREEFGLERCRDARLLHKAEAPLLLLVLIVLTVRVAIVCGQRGQVYNRPGLPGVHVALGEQCRTARHDGRKSRLRIDWVGYHAP